MSALLGIDLGTSSVKLLLRHSDGRVEKSRESYAEISPDGWWNALTRAAARLNLAPVDAIGLSSQVGTYIIDGKHVVGWNGSEGLAQLETLKASFDRDVFLREIGMAHPDMVSYPIPRLMYFSEAYPKLRSVCMPKELLIKQLTGNYVSDMYSWRGLADLENCRYSPFFMNWLGDPGAAMLPPLAKPTDAAGLMTKSAAAQLGVCAGVPVYTGCNDFFAALLGAGVRKSGDMFDITGTSEHLGGICSGILDEPSLISGRYFSDYVRYGVTASSGASVTYARSLHDGAIDPRRCRIDAPLFLPYINGERCPVCDPMAKGVMFGIGPDCDGETMAYSVMEGVAFNLRQILESLRMPADRILVCGGAAQDDRLNQLKADILGAQIVSLDEPDASAMGAALIAGVGCGEFAHFESAPAARQLKEYTPSGDFDYTRRYLLYKQLYPSLKHNFIDFGRL